MGPIALMMNILDCLGNAWVASEVVVVVGVNDVHLDVLMVGNIEWSLVVKEVTVFC